MWEPASNPLPLKIPETVEGEFHAVWMKTRTPSPSDSIPDISHLHFVDVIEAQSFKVAKRAEEHAAGRYLISHLLQQNGYDVKDYQIKRNEYRRPILIGPQPLSISISHSGGLAIAIIGPTELSVGIDVEPDSGRQRNLLPLMASGNELTKLEEAWDQNPGTASTLTNLVWVVKEAIQKATGLGMGLAPQSFEVLDKEVITINSQLYRIHSWQPLLSGQVTNVALAHMTDTA
jgi:phosphopantetheinyl transferase